MASVAAPPIETEIAVKAAGFAHKGHSKGEPIGAGASGSVNRLSSGAAIKSPWSSPEEINSRCRQELTKEAAIYAKLSPHPRLVRVLDFDPDQCTLTMEYMPNGDLRTYLSTHNDTISSQTRLQWMKDAAEGLHLLHSNGVLHCDFGPKNLLLDASLRLRIIDFGGSAFEDYEESTCPDTRFRSPNFNWTEPHSKDDDMFGLGSTIYTIATGKLPYHEKESNEVSKCYKAREFPDISEVACGAIIGQCWHGGVHSAQEVAEYVGRTLAQ